MGVVRKRTPRLDGPGTFIGLELLYRHPASPLAKPGRIWRLRHGVLDIYAPFRIPQRLFPGAHERFWTRILLAVSHRLRQKAAPIPFRIDLRSLHAGGRGDNL